MNNYNKLQECFEYAYSDYQYAHPEERIFLNAVCIKPFRRFVVGDTIDRIVVNAKTGKMQFHGVNNGLD